MGNVISDTTSAVTAPVNTAVQGGIDVIRDAQGNITGIINRAQDNVTSIIRDGVVLARQTERDFATVSNNLQQNISNSFQMTQDNIFYSYRDTTTKAVLAIDSAMDASIFTVNKLGTEVISTVQFGMFIFVFIPACLFALYGPEIMDAIKSVARNGSIKLAIV
jgi:hypothetical protein